MAGCGEGVLLVKGVMRHVSSSAPSPPSRPESSPSMERTFLARTVALAFAAAVAMTPRAHAQNTASTPPAGAAADSAAIVDASQLAVPPEIVNRRDVANALAQSYAKIGTQNSGRAVLTFIVDERGRTHDVEVAESSGYPEIDRGMVEVAKHMRWSPSVQDGHPVRVRVHLPMTYTRETP